MKQLQEVIIMSFSMVLELYTQFSYNETFPADLLSILE